MESEKGMQKPAKETQNESFSAGCHQSLRCDMPRTAGVAPSLVLIFFAGNQNGCRTYTTRILHCARPVNAVMHLIGGEPDRERQNVSHGCDVPRR